MEIEAPDLMELTQLCDFAETRLRQLNGDEDMNFEDDDPPTNWEMGCLTKTQAWLDKLKKLTASDKVKLASRSYEETQYQIEPMWVLSAYHLSEETVALLSENGLGSLIVYARGPYRWWISVHDDYVEAEAGVPDDLKVLLEHALSLGIEWLCLDDAADPHPDFPLFNW